LPLLCVEHPAIKYYVIRFEILSNAAAVVATVLYLIYLPYYHFFFIRYAIRGDSCVSYIYDFFFLIVVSYVTPFTYSHMQHIYILHIHIYFFISIIFIRLYSNNAFKALLAQRYYQTR